MSRAQAIGGLDASGNIVPIRVDADGRIKTTGGGGSGGGRDIATDGSKLDGIEANADVTDATNVAAAGAVMDKMGLYVTSLDYITTADHSSLDITGDIDIRLLIQPDEWTAGTGSLSERLLNKWSASTSQRSYQMRIEGKKIALFYSLTGTESLSAFSTVNVPFLNGELGWVRATRVASTGVIRFYISYDGKIWTQLGSSVSGTSGNLYVGTAPLGVGGDGDTKGLIGYLFYAEVRDGIGGRIVANPNLTTMGGTVLRDSAGKVYTIEGSNWSWKSFSPDSMTVKSIYKPSDVSDMRQCVVRGNYVYAAGMVTSAGDGLVIFDVSNKKNPVKVGEIGTDIEGASRVAVHENIAVVAGRDNGGFLVADISDPTNPQYLDSYVNADTIGARALAITSDGNYAYLACSTLNGYGTTGLRVFDISDPTNITRVAIVGDDVSNLGGGMCLLDEDNDLLYVSNYDDPGDAIIVWDISDRASPSLVIRQVLTDADHCRGIVRLDDNTLLMASQHNGAVIAIDVSTPTAPTYVSSLKLSAMNGVREIALKGSRLFGSGRASDELFELNVSDKNNLSLTRSITSVTHPYGLSTDDTYVYSVTDDGYLYIVDTTRGF